MIEPDNAPESVALYALTRRGAEIALRLAAPLRATVYANDKAARHLASQGFSGGVEVFASLPELLRAAFSRHSCHIFLCATGIAVRCIAPLLQGKDRDPAVLVIDQAARYVISLLSGHLGGANEQARRVAAILEARAVITTATDAEELPALECLAREKGLRVGNLEALPFVSAALLNGDPVLVHDPGDMLGLANGPWRERFVFADTPAQGPMAGHDAPCSLPPAARGLGPVAATAGPREGPVDPLTPCTDPDARGQGAVVETLPACVFVGVKRPPSGPAGRRWLHLHPPLLCAGVGCKRGASAGQILEALQQALDKGGYAAEALACLASLDAKTDEPGLVRAAAGLGLPLLFFSSRELAAFPVSAPSAKALEQFGLQGVCEPAALAAAAWREGAGSLVQPKTTLNGVTVALALRSPERRAHSGPRQALSDKSGHGRGADGA